MAVEACFCHVPVTVAVEAVSGRCPKGYAPGAGWPLGEMVPAGWCPYLLHTVAGYVGCVRAGAGFGTTAGKGIEAQCPNPDVGVVVAVTPAPGGAVAVRVLGHRAPCPDFRLEAGTAWLADGGEFCLTAYDGLMPYVNGVVAAALGGEAAVGRAGCQGCAGGRVVFRITAPGTERKAPCASR